MIIVFRYRYLYKAGIVDPDPDPDPVGSGPFLLDPEPDLENFHRIRILSVLWQCKVVKTRKKYFKNRAFTHFQVNFSIFSEKKIIIQISEEICLMWEKILMFELILGKCQ